MSTQQFDEALRSAKSKERTFWALTGAWLLLIVGIGFVFWSAVQRFESTRTDLDRMKSSIQTLEETSRKLYEEGKVDFAKLSHDRIALQTRLQDVESRMKDLIDELLLKVEALESHGEESRAGLFLQLDNVTQAIGSLGEMRSELENGLASADRRLYAQELAMELLKQQQLSPAESAFLVREGENTGVATRSANADPTSLLLAAAGRIEEGQDAEAIALLTEVIDDNEGAMKAYLLRAYALANTTKYKDAIIDLSKAIELDAHNPTAYGNRGVSYHAIKEYDEAISDFSQALEIDPKDAMAYMGRAASNAELGDLDKAYADFAKSLELDPNHWGTYKNRGYFRMLDGNLDGAREDFEKAIMLKPNQANPHAHLGNVFRLQGEMDSAMSALERAILLDPEYGPSHEYLALLQKELGLEEESKSDQEGVETLSKQN